MAKYLSKIVLFALLIGLSGCKISYHLKQSKRHYDKAIEKGYQPENIISTTDATLDLTLDIDYSSKISATILSAIDSTAELVGLTDNQKQAVTHITKLKIIESTKHIDVDTAITLTGVNGDSLGFINIKSKRGKLYIHQEHKEAQPIYIEQSFFDLIGVKSWWQKGLFWLLIAMLIFLFAYRIIK